MQCETALNDYLKDYDPKNLKLAEEELIQAKKVSGDKNFSKTLLSLDEKVQIEKEKLEIINNIVKYIEQFQETKDLNKLQQADDCLQGLSQKDEHLFLSSEVQNLKHKIDELRQNATIYSELERVYRLENQTEEKNNKFNSFPQGNSAGESITLSIEGIKYDFRWCPSGTFSIGSPTGEIGREKNEKQHEVTLTKGFWILETEVTQEMFMSIMDENPSYFVNNNPELIAMGRSWGIDISKQNSSQNPVEQVTYSQAIQFCNKLNQLLFEWEEHFTLPTEAQWEYACRAGKNNRFGVDKEKIVYNQSYGTWPVRSTSPNNWGIYDMNGNVSEWCFDYYANYDSEPVTDPCQDTVSKERKRVVRGGSWKDNDLKNCRSASRFPVLERETNNELGFRIIFGY